MAALNPRLLRDTSELIYLYKRNPAFRERFDMAVRRNVNVTYKNRPLKLYFEVLASSNRKYKNDYIKVRRLIRQDPENIIRAVFLKITTKDLENLGSQARQAEANINATAYSNQEVEEINRIEETANSPIQKRQLYTNRFDKQRWLAPANKTSQPEPSASIPPSEHKESSPPSSNQPVLQHPSTSGKIPPSSKSTPDLSGSRSWSARVRGFFRGGVSSATEKVGVTTVTEGVVTKVGARFAAGRAVTAGVGRLAAKLGVSTAVKAVVGIAAKLGVSLVTGIATAGVGLAVGIIVIIITTFPGLIKELFKIILWGGLGVIILLVFMMISQRGIKMNSLLPPYSVGFAEPLPPGGGDITSCTFYRSGVGEKFRIAQWPALISEVAYKVGVPAAILAGILRVECPDCFLTINPEYITNDYDAHSNGFAYGLMQFYPPTFENTFNSNRSQMESLFGKTSVRTQIDPQNSMAPANVLRIYSIKDSLIAAAFKVRIDAGGSPPYTRSNIDNIVNAYFTKCEYTEGGNTYNYCDELWRSYSECQSTPTLPPIAGAVCPIPGGSISCGSIGYGNPSDSGCLGGHCSPSYISINPTLCTDYPSTKYGVDIPQGAGLPVFIPTIKDPATGTVKTLTCTLVYSLPGDSGVQYINQFKCGIDGDTASPRNYFYIQFHHLNNYVPPGPYQTGSVAGTVFSSGGDHTHVQIGLNGACQGSTGSPPCVVPEQYLQCN